MKKKGDSIEQVLHKTIEVMESSKGEVFEISASARQEAGSLQRELTEVMVEIDQAIELVDKLEVDFRKARTRLSEVSRDFKRFTEKDIKHAYEMATAIQLDVLMHREKEIYLRDRRDDLRQRLRNLERTIERAEVVTSQMTVVLDYLSGDLHKMSEFVENAKNRQLIGFKIILAQEEERKRIAREIHDDLAQSLANVILRTEIVERAVGTQKDSIVKREIEDLRGQVRLSLEEVRKMIFNLRPMALDDLGFIPALRRFVNYFEDKFKIRAKFVLKGKELRLPSAVEAAIYRIVQEAFSNIQKHAEASYVQLTLKTTETSLLIEIEDNGIGFELDEISTEAMDGGHFGIIGMKERINLLEGTFLLDSKKNEGTTISIEIPLGMES